MAHLLDVNLLIALAWPSHVHHRQAHNWFGSHNARGWATCPLTQCGFVRVSSNVSLLPQAVSPREAIALLRKIAEHPSHEFWPDELALTQDLVPTDRLMGHRQITDSYLLGLAIHHGGKLATLDRGISSLISGAIAAKYLELVPVA